MCSSLNRAPVVPGSDRESVDAIHDALVVRRRPVWIYAGNVTGKHDTVPNKFSIHAVASECGQRIAHASLHDRSIGQIRKNSQRHIAAADVRYQRCDKLTDRIDEVGTHRVTGIDKHVHSEQRRAVRQFERSKLHAPYAATPGAKPWMNFVRHINKIARRGSQGCQRCVTIGDTRDMYLTDQQ